jgi:hypothetical protein
MLDRLLADNIASVQGRFRFDQNDVDLVFRHWHVFDSTGNDNEFSGADSNIAVAQPYEQLTLRHEEQLVLIFVMMPNELAFELCQLDVGVVQLGGDLWSPVVAEQIEFLSDIHFVTPEYNYGPPAVLKNAIDRVYPEWNRKAAAFVSYGGVGGARSVQQLREVAIEVQLAPIRSSVHIPVATLWAHFQGGDVDKGLAELEKPASVMIDDLLWWTTALKTARKG